MKKRFSLSPLTTVFLVLNLSILIFSIVLFNTGQLKWEDVGPNLFTELLGITITLVLVEWYFRYREKKELKVIEDRINNKLARGVREMAHRLNPIVHSKTGAIILPLAGFERVLKFIQERVVPIIEDLDWIQIQLMIRAITEKSEIFAEVLHLYSNKILLEQYSLVIDLEDMRSDINSDYEHHKWLRSNEIEEPEYIENHLKSIKSLLELYLNTLISLGDSLGLPPNSTRESTYL